MLTVYKHDILFFYLYVIYREEKDAKRGKAYKFSSGIYLHNLCSSHLNMSQAGPNGPSAKLHYTWKI